ncbi:MAG: response regulator transcription factor [Sinomicrobium sp.]|nr:response regulator transcription factor [Sinomicrobium sp.]
MQTEPILYLALADDELLFIKGIGNIIHQRTKHKVLYEAKDGSELLDILAEAKKLPDIVLLDLKMEPLDGIATTQQLRENYPDIKIIILSSYYSESFIGYMIKQGVNAFLPKNCTPEQLVFAIHKVAEKDIFLDEALANAIRRQALLKLRKKPAYDAAETITKREKEVLNLICQELSNKEIAEELCMSLRTAESHRESLLRKTGAKNTAGLVIFALMNQLVDVDKKLMEFTLSH